MGKQLLFLLSLLLFLVSRSYQTSFFDNDNLIDVECDVIIAGGSTSALAAALAAAKQSSDIHVCLLESTDWAGGQLTSSAVSAIDFGPANAQVVNQPKDFSDMLNTTSGVNPGVCWVSLKCR
jgi:hypothetical protein